jgi:hypothetical protein
MYAIVVFGGPAEPLYSQHMFAIFIFDGPV